ncbi:MAG: SurA N-terminal domain-containing protein [Alphaproteobacteria bacterium]
MRALFSMHRVVARAVLVVIFALLILSFALWGTGDLLRGRVSRGAVALVGDAEIAQGEFLRAWQNREVAHGGERGRREADEALRLLVDSELLAQEGEHLQLRLGAEDISLEVADYVAFQGPTGEFDALRFENFLVGTGFSEAEFADRFGRDIQTQRLQSALLSGVQGSEPLARLLTEYDELRRVGRYIRIVTESRPEEELPPEADLEAYYETIKNDYRSHEFRSVSWVWLDADALRSEVEVDESALREVYEELLESRFTEAERRTFWQEVVGSEEEARTLLKEYATLAEEMAVEMESEVGEVKADTGTGTGAEAEAEFVVAESTEGNAENAGDAEESLIWDDIFADVSLGPVTTQELDESVAAALFAANAGLLTEPVESPFGWHVLALGAIEAEVVTSFEDARSELEEQYIDAAVSNRVIEEANRFDEVLNEGLTLTEAGSALGLELESGTFNSFGYDQEGAQLEGLIADKRFRDAVFALEETDLGETGLLAETEAGGYYALRMDEVIPRADRPFSELVDAIGDRWQGERKSESASALAEELAERVRNGESLETLAEELELEVETTEPLARRAQWPLNYLAVDLFGITEKDAVRVSEIESDFAVAVLEDVEGADFLSRESREALFQREGELRIDRLNEVFGQYMDALREQYGVSVNDALVTQVIESPYLR